MRRNLLLAGFAALALCACASPTANESGPRPGTNVIHPSEPGDRFTEEEVVNAGARFFGTTSETFAAAIERVFNENGRPVGYIEGEEGSGAFVVGLRYGNGTLVLRNGARRKVFWQGPSVGFDAGGNASKVFTLVYGLNDPDRLYQRFPGVDGSAYVVAGIGVNYQRADEITLAPVRTGVGLRFGVNLGYLAYSRKQRANPF